MFGKKKRSAPPRGQGAAAARQMGLFVDLDPQEMMLGMEGNLEDPDLEAELAAITGNKTAGGGRTKPKGKSPLPMEDIARMADECMKDVDEDEDDDLMEDDEDLLAELQEVVGDEEDEEDEDAVAASSSSSSLAESSQAETREPPSEKQQEVTSSSAAPGSVQQTLEDRTSMYRKALQNAKTSGETTKARRYERGLKTLESMLASVRKGRPVNEAEIPPPVATGAPSSAPRPAPSPAPRPAPPPAVPSRPPPPVPSPPEAPQQDEASTMIEESVPTIVTPSVEDEQTSLQKEEKTEEASQTNANEATKTLLLQKQKEFRMAALKAKKDGDVELAKNHYKTSKRFDVLMEALDKGQTIDLNSLPASPGQAGSSAPMNRSSSEVVHPVAAASAPSAPSPPKDVLEALEQRRAKYVEASVQAKANGDQRKARMHERIAKQYQSAIRAHKAGRDVNFDELPAPPGFPPIPGQKETRAEQGLVEALEAANKLTSDDADAEDEEDEDKDQETKAAVPEELKTTLDVPPEGPRRRSSSASPDRSAPRDGLSPTALQQLDFLENRRKLFLKAALQAKQRKEVDQAKNFLRIAKSFDPMMEAARGGKTVDLSSVPSPPGDEDEDFILVHHSDVQISEKDEQVYVQLVQILKEQHEKCMIHSKQFTHLGNVAETTRFEKLAENCKKSLEVVKLSQSRGLPPPRHHFEDRSFKTVRIFPELSSTDMVVVVVKGMNLPAPSGIQTNDLDAFVRFDFPYPSSEQPQKHKTSVIKNTNCPEFNQSFSVSINRNHRGFRRLVASKGLKLELLHKGGFLRSDKPIGTALVKLEKLESQSEIREIVEVMDGRKATGGRLEVKVRLREPLIGQDMQSSTERWLLIDSAQGRV